MQIFEVDDRYVLRHEQAQMKGMWDSLPHIPRTKSCTYCLAITVHDIMRYSLTRIGAVSVQKGPFAVLDLDHIAWKFGIGASKTQI